LAARGSIVAESPVDEVEIIVVSDGSTDQTAETAGRFEQVRLIVFEQNRGYGAAIKRGFAEATGELLGFLDADGTCDPRFFAELCRAIVEDRGAVAIGSRMGPQSHMPKVRRLGNRVYAWLLSALSNKGVTDTASGMRVVRRDVLERLYPLPDGLHFTPAMSARVLLDDQLTLLERPMAYDERIGRSKLKVVRDGFRFLRTILETALWWRPGRLLGAAGILCLLVSTLLAVHLLEQGLREGRWDGEMAVRLIACLLLTTLASVCFGGRVICDHVFRLVEQKPRPRTFGSELLSRMYTVGWSGAWVSAGLILCLVLVAPLFGSGLASGRNDVLWRIVAACVIVTALAQFFVFALMAHCCRFHAKRKREQVVDRPIKAAVVPAEAVSRAESMFPKELAFH